jgi:glycerol-3-phosphate dehydrogenase
LLPASNASHTLTLTGYSQDLRKKLAEEYGLSSATAKRLARAYGGRAWDIMTIARNELGQKSQPALLAPEYPYLEAEVIYAVRHEWAECASDILARRTRLAFLNKEKALAALPRVVQLMAKELRWSEARQKEEIANCLEYMRQFGGPTPNPK